MGRKGELGEEGEDGGETWVTTWAGTPRTSANHLAHP